MITQFRAPRTFDGFGPNLFDPFVPRPLFEVSGADPNELRRQVVGHAPRAAGVYGMLNAEGQLIYIGKSAELRARLLSYFTGGSRQAKAGRIIASTHRLVWERQPSEFAATLREEQLIRSWQPTYNVQHVPRRRQAAYLCLGRAPAAHFFVAGRPPREWIALRGPLASRGRCRHAADALNRFYHLRDCNSQVPMHFRDQRELFPVHRRAGCLRLEIRNCLGPCAAACSQAEYQRHVDAAAQFLRAEVDEPLRQLGDAMRRAAASCQFELAARLRDDLRALEYVHGQLTLAAEAERQYRFVYAAPSRDCQAIWYLIHGGQVAATIPAPICAESYARSRHTLRHWGNLLDQPLAAGNREAGTRALVAGWFRRHRDQLSRTFLPSEAGRRYRRLAADARCSRTPGSD